MALVPGNEEAFRREVDDAVRADQMQSLAKRFGVPLIAAIIVGLAALGGWLYWQHRQAIAAGENGTVLSRAIDDLVGNRPRAATTAAEPLTKDGGPTYGTLARLVQAGAAITQTPPAQDAARTAVARLSAIAADTSAPEEMRNLAVLRQTLIEFETLAPAKVVERLQPLVAQPGPAFASAAELSAIAEMKRGNDRAALELYRRIARTPNVSDSLKQRASQMASMLGASTPVVSARANAAAPAAATTTSAPAPAPTRQP